MTFAIAAHSTGMVMVTAPASSSTGQPGILNIPSVAELERRDSQLWDAQFAASHDVLNDIYDEIMRESRAGRTFEVG